MKLISSGALRRAIVLTTGFFVLSCRESPTAPQLMTAPDGIAREVVPAASPIVISQLYGGGGNAGATLTNDFIELFNTSGSAVDVTGWSVQYASSAGTTWQVTNISGVIPAGGYYLVQEAVGAGGTTALPTPDATGTIPLAATAGKIALVSSTTALSGACPVSSTYLDLIAFGSGTACGTFAPAPSNTTADIRGNAGCTYSGSPSADFAAAAPTPRNSATATHSCVVGGVPTSATVTPATASTFTGSTVTFSAAAKDGFGNPASTAFTWTSSNTAVATIDASGVATGVGGGVTTITATTSNSITATAQLTVVALVNQSGNIVISQVYGGGGNAGAPLTNDYIELFNRSTSPVNVTGWSVQYSSAAGSFTQATPLSGTIPSGGYYLVQEAAGAASPAPLPTPDATGTMNMSGTSGKILLAQTATPLGTACPTGAIAVDEVSYGSVSPACGTATAVLSNTTAAIRNSGGCAWTPDASLDFSVLAPAPRNSATATRSCVAGPLDHVTITGSLAVLAGATTQLAAHALDAIGNTVPGASVVWTTSDATIATVDATGKVTGVVASGDAVTITATVTAGGITKSAAVQVQVNGTGINWIDISSSSASLPPGFQTQIFATARQTQGGTIIDATFTFESVDPTHATIQTVQNTGIFTGVAAPTDGSKPGIRVTATPTGGGAPYVFITHPVTVEVPHAAPTSIYAVNDEFGDPTAVSASNPLDRLIRRPQYTISYNESHGTPNWVSYELDSRQSVAGQDRCNCFTADPLLPADKQIFTSDYTNGGFDRGHMTRSADRTAGNVDNAITFYLSNVVPQQADLNQGVWAQFENALADSAAAGRAVYIITGPLYSRTHGLTFLKNEGKVAIPDSTWKVALIGPGNGGNPFTNGNVQSWTDLSGLTLMVVNMPNISGVRNDPWAKYLTTVEKLEASTGYNFLSLLQTGFRAAIEYHDHGPSAAFSLTGTQIEGSALTFDASASTDADLGRTDLGRTEALSYAWHFSDGSDAIGKIVSHTFANDGNYTATLTVTDAFGWPGVTSSSVAVANVAPVPTLSLAAGALLPGEAISGTGSFSDPGADSWTATVNYGDGSGASTLTLSGMQFSLSHVYASAGVFTVTVSIADGSTTGVVTGTVTVLTQPTGLDSASALIDGLQAAGRIPKGSANSYQSRIAAARDQLIKDHTTPVTAQLSSIISDINSAVNAGEITAADGAAIISLLNRIIASVNIP